MSVEFLSCRYMSEHLVDDNNDTFGDFFLLTQIQKDVISVNWDLTTVI